MTNDWRVTSLLVNCFYRLTPTLKQDFNELLHKKIIDKAIWEMIQGKLFPEWFGDKMSFDSLSGKLNGLREALNCAAIDYLISVNKTNSDYYFIDFEKDELVGMARHIGFTEQEVIKLSEELNDRLFNTN